MLKNVFSSSLVAVALLAVCVWASLAQAQQIRSTRVASGLNRPVFVTAPPGDTSRLFIVEQSGRIKVMNLPSHTINATNFLDVSTLIGGGTGTGGDERGLLGMAFHPEYASNGTFFIYYYSSGAQTVVRRYQVSADPNVANAGSGTNILTMSQPFSNHNGGWIGFGPDGYLYIASGDGGSGNDPNNAGQNLSTLLGKLLRINVGPTGTYTVPATNPFAGATAPFNTIWAYGLRNPYRCSFDRQTGQLYIGDVGQSAREEINIQPADVNGSMGGRNYGWRCMEGTNCTGLSGCTCNAANLILPVHQYVTGSNCAIIGGSVYRGSAIPSMQGHYFFGDYCSGRVWSFEYTGANNPPVVERTSALSPSIENVAITRVSTIGEDAAGELYITSVLGGNIFKIIPAPPSNDTCGGAILVGNGTFAFNTASASTTGPNEPNGCGFGGNTQISNDLWYKYLAQCDGVATASLCGANFDTRMAVYAVCPTGSGQAIACNDDFCGTASQISFPVMQGTLYQIRIGGNNAVGSGDLVISCGAPPSCPADITGDNQVNVSDLLAVINAWGPCPPAPQSCPADIAPPGGDGAVNVSDLLLVINNWGPCP